MPTTGSGRRGAVKKICGAIKRHASDTAVTGIGAAAFHSALVWNAVERAVHCAIFLSSNLGMRLCADSMEIWSELAHSGSLRLRAHGLLD